MTIRRLRHVTLLAPAAATAQVLAALQAKGCVHLIAPGGLSAPGAEKPGRLRDFELACRHLEAERRRRRPAARDAAFDADAIVDAALHNQRQRQAARERIERLDARIAERAEWGEFTPPDPARLGGNRLWLCSVPFAHVATLVAGAAAWTVTGRDPRRVRLAVLSPAQPAAPAATVVDAGSLALSALRAEHEAALRDLDLLDVERQALTRWLPHLHRARSHAADRALLDEACALPWRRGALAAIEGWVDARDEAAMHAFGAQHGCVVSTRGVRHDDDPPTLLDTRPSLRGGSDIVTFYQTPAYHAWDPSGVVLASFVVFFSLIVADAAYGAAFALLVLALWRRLAVPAPSRRLRATLAWLAGGTIAAGVAAGSYAGMTPPPGGLLASLQVVAVADHATTMRIAMGIGVVHLCIANLARSARAATRAGRLQPLGWCLAIAGGHAYWLGGGTAAAAVAIAGLLAVFAFASDRPPRGARALLARAGKGLLALTSVSRAFGDVLSYVRLSALALAGGALAATINELAAALHATPGVGPAASLLVLAAGHGVNVLLAVVGGVVHGLRLNYIEFFGWALDGEGHPFRAFRREEAA
jgi:V/A-type H+-transporting ATPase subunit I